MPECRSLGVTSPGQLAFFEVEPPALSAGGIAVRTVFSGLSTGTELGYVKGTDPAFASRRDPELGVFLPGQPSLRYPVTAMGYMEVGQVAESRRPDVREGTLVAAAYGHRDRHVLSAGDFAFPVPADVDPLLAVYLAQMGPICANGLLHAAAEHSAGTPASLGEGVVGRRVLVTGAGVIGLLTALFALHHGAREVAVADPDTTRLAVAAALGAEVVDTGTTPAWQWCKERWKHGAGDRGADLVFQCRGRAAVLQEALQCLRPQGTVIDLAFYQGGAPELRLGEEFHHNAVRIVAAQIGNIHPAWTVETLRARAIALALQRRLVLGGLPRLELPVERAAEGFAALRRPAGVLQVALRY
jgi:threonine dehydrogenase-like Zn-dependent dehydrogenase